MKKKSSFTFQALILIFLGVLIYFMLKLKLSDEQPPNLKESKDIVLPLLEVGEWKLPNIKTNKKRLLKLKKNEEHLPRLKASEEQLPRLKASEEQLPRLKASEEQLPRLKVSEEQLPRLKASEEHLPMPYFICEINEVSLPVNNEINELPSIVNEQIIEPDISNINQNSLLVNNEVNEVKLFMPAPPCQSKSDYIVFFWSLSNIMKLNKILRTPKELLLKQPNILNILNAWKHNTEADYRMIYHYSPTNIEDEERKIFHMKTHQENMIKLNEILYFNANNENNVRRGKQRRKQNQVRPL